MNPRSAVLLGVLLFSAAPSQGAATNGTLALHPDNPRYFTWRGHPLVIIGSGEHYGAVLNADFDFKTYLATLGRDGLNHTRTFTGAAYIEPQGAFTIAQNTLAPGGTATSPRGPAATGKAIPEAAISSTSSAGIPPTFSDCAPFSGRPRATRSSWR